MAAVHFFTPKDSDFSLQYLSAESSYATPEELYDAIKRSTARVMVIVIDVSSLIDSPKLGLREGPFAATFALIEKRKKKGMFVNCLTGPVSKLSQISVKGDWAV